MPVHTAAIEEKMRLELPELPDQKAKRFEETWGLIPYDARHLVEHRATANFFEDAMGVAGKDAKKLAKPLANLMLNDISARMNADASFDLLDCPLTPERAIELVRLLAEDTISSKQGREVLAAVLDEDKDPAAIVDERGMRQVSDTGALQEIVDTVLARCEDQAQQYRDGNQKVLGFLVGQCMKESRGKGNPKLFNELLRASLS